MVPHERVATTHPATPLRPFIPNDPRSFARATASTVKIASCTASSEFDGNYPCRNAYDGNMADGWATDKQGTGSWIKLQFAGAQAITAMNFANRHGEESKGLKLEFSDGSTCSAAAFLLGPGRIALRIVW